jgi:hypothetical protein
MNIKYFICILMALSLIFVEGCGTPANSNQPWDKPIREDNGPAVGSPDFAG